jgi:hypothetical protein
MHLTIKNEDALEQPGVCCQSALVLAMIEKYNITLYDVRNHLGSRRAYQWKAVTFPEVAFNTFGYVEANGKTIGEAVMALVAQLEE